MAFIEKTSFVDEFWGAKIRDEEVYITLDDYEVAEVVEVLAEQIAEGVTYKHLSNEFQVLGDDREYYDYIIDGAELDDYVVKAINLIQDNWKEYFEKEEDYEYWKEKELPNYL